MWLFEEIFLTDCNSEVKARTVLVKLVSSAMTGFTRTVHRPRGSNMITQIRYDPFGTISSHRIVIYASYLANLFSFSEKTRFIRRVKEAASR